MTNHDPTICGIDPSTDCPKCRPRTVSFQRREQHMSNLEALQKRLEKAGIDVDDFCDLLWMRLQPTIDEQVRKVMHETVRLAMKDMKIHGKVSLYDR